MAITVNLPPREGEGITDIASAEADALAAIAAQQATSVAAVAVRETEATEAGGPIDVREDLAVTTVAGQETTSVAAVAAAGALVTTPVTGTIAVAEAASLLAISNAEAAILDPGGTLPLAETAAIASVSAAGIAAVDAEAAAQAVTIGDLGAAATASASAAAGATFYADPTAGLAGTSSGQTFLVWGDGSTTYALLYLNNAGSADLLATYPDAAAVTAAVDSINTTVRYIGQPAPITGSAAGNTTYIIDNVSDETWTVSEIYGFGLSSGGDIYIKALDDSTGSWTGRALGTVTLEAGSATLAVDYELLPGERLAVWGQSIIPTVGNGGGLTGYYTLAGNVLTGAIGSATTNTALQIGFKLVARRREIDSSSAARDARTSDARIKFLGLADADLGSSLSSATAYYDPRPLPAGTPELLYAYGRTAGWATLVLDVPADETQWERYFQMPVLLDAGKTPITRGDATPGRGFPVDLVIREGTIFAFICPSGGGQIAYTATDGPGTAGENLIGYRLPQGSFQGTAAGGVRALTVSATSNRQLAVEWHITEAASPRKLDRQRKMFADVTFPGTTLPIDLYAQGTAPTFSAGYAQSAATGFGNNLRQRFGHCFDQQRRRVVQMFGDATSKVVADIRPIGGGYGTSAMADVAANQWTVYVAHAAVSSTPAATAGFPRTWPGTFDATNSILVWDFLRTGRTFRVTLTDIGVQPVVSDYYEVDISAADIPPASGGIGTESASLNLMGQMNGAVGSLAIAGSVKTIGVMDGAVKRNYRGLIVGDSISNASRCDYADGWAQQLQADLATRGIEVAIIAIDGLDMPNGCKTAAQALTLLPDLEWCIVALGTNRSSADETRNTNMFEASAQALLYRLQERDIDPYFMVPVPHTYSPGAATQATLLAWLETTDFTLIRGDLALTQSDGVTIDGTLFYGGGSGDVHPIAAGHDNLFTRVKIDAPRLWY